MKKVKFDELMLYLLEKYPDVMLSLRASHHLEKLDYRIKKVSEGNVMRDVSIDEVAFLCNTSASSFKRHFRKIYGIPPNKWFLQKKMEIAKELLIHYHEKPSEIYHKVGFKNHSSFSKSFRRTYGVSPSKFQISRI